MTRLVILGPMGIGDEDLRGQAMTLMPGLSSVDIHPDVTSRPDAMIALTKHAEVLVIANLPLPEQVIAACPDLRMVCAAFTGMDRVDIAACKKRNIQVCNTPGYSTPAVGEFTIALMLGVLRKIVEANTAARKGGTFKSVIGRELAGSTIGILGTGAIGLQVAKLLAGFDCRILAYSRTQSQAAKGLGVTYLDLEDVLVKSDIISLHLPLNSGTKHLLNASRLALMKPDAILINTARGDIIDNDALAKALTQNRLAGAGLDTIDMRPPYLAGHALLNAPNVLMTPHMAFATTQAFQRRAQLVMKTIAAWQTGNPITEC